MSTTNKNMSSFFEKKYDLATWLFFCALIIYLITRLIGLSKFPIYFFTDEANQTQSVVSLVNNHYRIDGVFLPTYFANGLYYNLGLSVYAQWLPYILFGKSAVLTRLTSVLITLIAASSIGLVLRDIFNLKYWWTGTLFLSITPAWFLHSRTAFETVEFTSFYTGAICAYFYYRYYSPRYLYLALLLAACAFYSYSPAQLIVPLTIVCLTFSDLHYHMENRQQVKHIFFFFLILCIPYLRFLLYNPQVPLMHLSTLGSYLITNSSTSEKLSRYLSEYSVGISVWYWYMPNVKDLSRHLMKDYGHIMIATLPFAILGLTSILRNLNLSKNRTLLIIMLISPSAAALVGISITRSMTFIIVAALLTAIGFEKITLWILDPQTRLKELQKEQKLNLKRSLNSLIILGTGVFFGIHAANQIDRIVIIAITFISLIQLTGLDRQIANIFLNVSKKTAFIKTSDTLIASFTFVILAGMNFWMLADSLSNGPTWYTDYGLYGMQYGGFQLFEVIKEYKQEQPDTTIIISPDWANGTNVIASFFLDEQPSIRLGSILGYMKQKWPIDDSMLFVMTSDEYQQIKQDPKFTDIHIERILPYPDGRPGFYFIKLKYSSQADAIFAAEEAERNRLQETHLILNGEDVKLRYSHLDGDYQNEAIALLFDGDPLTLAKTYEARPFIVEITYPSLHTINGFSIIVGSTAVVIKLTGYAYQGSEPITYTFRGRGTAQNPELSFELPEPLTALIFRLEQSKNHIWEITFR